MRSSIQSLLLFVAGLVALNAQAQSERKPLTETAGSISGHVTLGGKPAQGVKVIAFKGEHLFQGEPAATARTDQSGHFQLSNLPSDRYHIMPIAPAFIASEQADPNLPGQVVPLADGETIEGLDFALVRGGVITGRITDEDGQPLTGETVTLIQLDSNGQKRPLYYFRLYTLYEFSISDDQGNYRIFGLPPGRYLVSVGETTDNGGSRIGTSSYHSITYYPGVMDESKAGIVGLDAGAVATGIDIVLGHKIKAYSASGRIINANTGKPASDAQLGYGIMHEGGGSFNTEMRADARGNFRLDGLLPGSFYVMAIPGAESGLYSNVASFQIKDQDITGLEIKIRTGSSISGAVAVEGTTDPDVIAKLSRLKLWASVSSPDIIRDAQTSKIGAVSADGGFQIAGLHPGKVSVGIINNPESKGFFISRVERGGVEYANGIEVRPDENVNGVRVILGYASGRIRGLVKIQGGKLPADTKISVFVRRVGGPDVQSFPNIEVDPNGRFLIEALLTGEYEISAHVFRTSIREGGSYSPLAKEVSQKVSVINGAESNVMLVVELIAKDKDQ
ncbi:MAG: carboxypeptidase-like regulatory domain-containing protein [Blastocatellia bacterium]